MSQLQRFVLCVVVKHVVLPFEQKGGVGKDSVVALQGPVTLVHVTEQVKFGSATEKKSEVRSSVKVAVDVLGSPPLMVLVVSVDVKQH